MNYPKIAIIVINHNGLLDTKKCLQSLLTMSYTNFEVYLLDNGSKNNEAELLKKQFSSKKIHFLRLDKNLGFSGGNNTILPYLKHKYVVLLNNDTTVTKKWLFPLLRLMEKDSSIAIAQPKILWMKNKKYFDYSGACGGFIDTLGYTFTRGRIFDTLEKDEGQYGLTDIFWASGAAMIIRNSVLKKVGYFDELFFNYMEEVDLCYRVQRSGYRIVCEPKSYIYHKVAATASKNMLKKRFLEHRNNLLIMIKNYPIQKLITIFPLRLSLEYISIVYYLYKLQFSFAFAVMQSQLSLLFIAPLFVYERLGKTHRETNRMKELIFNNSIIWNYFVLQKKQFPALFVSK